MFAHQAAQPLIDLQEKLRAAVGKPKREFVPPAKDPAIVEQASRSSPTRRSKRRWRSATSTSATRRSTRPARETKAALAETFPDRGAEVGEAFEAAKKKHVRELVLDDRQAHRRPRAPADIRAITCEVGVLPRTHGSALFTRGETQALVTTTLGTSQDAQHIDALIGDVDKRFMLHYNFPPFSTGETKPLRGASRREIGHGDLAERALARVLPSDEGLPLHDPHRLRDPRVERQLVDGVGVRRHPVADGRAACRSRRRSPASRWASSRRATASPSCPTSSATRITSATWTSRSAAPSTGVTAVQMDIKIQGLTREILRDGAAPGPRRPAPHPRQDGRGAGRAARGAVAATRRASSRCRSSPTRSATSSARAARPSAASSSRPASRSTSRTTARSTSRRPTASRSRRRSTSSRASRPSPRSASSTWAWSSASPTSARSSRSCPAPTAWSTSASSTRSACSAVQDVCKEGDEMLVKVIGIDRATARSACRAREAIGKTPDVVHNFRAVAAS